ncbi:MAG: ribonuclease P protein component [Dehalococcoidia bacterium]|nr:ribonuclease P protein component [Dehalococcoidia bacterium]
MKEVQRLIRSADFAQVYERGKWLNSGCLSLKYCSNDLDVSRFGFVVSKRVGGAVVRNQVKRRLREIIRSVPLRHGRDVIVSARPQAAIASFSVMQTTLMGLLERVGLIINDEKNRLSYD